MFVMCSSAFLLAIAISIPITTERMGIDLAGLLTKKMPHHLQRHCFFDHLDCPKKTSLEQEDLYLASVHNHSK